MYDACIDDGWDGEKMQPCTVTMRRARKVHSCDECRQPINPGELYEHCRGLSDGYWDTFKTCESCKRMRDSIFRTWLYGAIWESFELEYGFSPFEVPDCDE
jgi:hypothetical protein